MCPVHYVSLESFLMIVNVINKRNKSILLETTETIHFNNIHAVHPSYDIWFDQILKKIWKSQYLCHFWTFGLIWYHKCHFQTIWYNFVITNIIFNIFGKYLYLVLSLHWYLMQFKRFFGAKFIKNRENLCYLLIFM